MSDRGDTKLKNRSGTLSSTHLNISKDILDSLNDAILGVSEQGEIRFANVAAEHLFLMSQSQILQRKLRDLLKDSPVCLASIEKAINQGRDLTEYDVTLRTRDQSQHQLGLKVGRLSEHENLSFVQFDTRSIADKINRQMQYLNAAKSAAGAAAMLAHEIKNP